MLGTQTDADGKSRAGAAELPSLPAGGQEEEGPRALPATGQWKQ